MAIEEKKKINLKVVDDNEFTQMWKIFLDSLKNRGFVEHFVINPNERTIQVRIAEDFNKDQISEYIGGVGSFDEFLSATFFKHLNDLKRDALGITDDKLMLTLPIYSVEEKGEGGKLIIISY